VDPQIRRTACLKSSMIRHRFVIAENTLKRDGSGIDVFQTFGYIVHRVTISWRFIYTTHWAGNWKNSPP